MPVGWGILNVLVKVVGIASSSESESCAAGGTTAGVPCSPWSTMVSDSAPCCVLLDLLGGILASGMRGIDSGLDGGVEKRIGLTKYSFFRFFDDDEEEKKDRGERTTRA